MAGVWRVPPPAPPPLLRPVPPTWLTRVGGGGGLGEGGSLWCTAVTVMEPLMGTDRRESHHLDSSLMCSGWRSHWERHPQPPQYVGGGGIMYVSPYKICFILLVLPIFWVFFDSFFPRGFWLQAHLRVSNRHYVVRICNTAYRLKNTEPCSGWKTAWLCIFGGLWNAWIIWKRCTGDVRNGIVKSVIYHFQQYVLSLLAYSAVPSSIPWWWKPQGPA